MYVYQLEKEQVVAFITGFETGSGGEVNISEQVSEWLKTEHRITKSNPGWPGQVQQYADQKGIGWFNAFNEIVSTILHLQTQ
ncbi:hypothetical protein SAMN05216311_10325 [Chitinophaga sp. CF418]|nr:hypothetical protein SAMN05216311_10325 [Chitinophaga sp. CF418]